MSTRNVDAPRPSDEESEAVKEANEKYSIKCSIFSPTFRKFKHERENKLDCPSTTTRNSEQTSAETWFLEENLDQFLAFDRESFRPQTSTIVIESKEASRTAND